MKKLAILLALLASIAAAYVFAGPYLVLYRMHIAAMANDPKALALEVDFKSLKKSIQEEILRKSTGEATPTSGLAQIVNAAVSPVVNVAVSPTGVALLLKGIQMGSQDKADPKDSPKLTSVGYTGLDVFEASVSKNADSAVSVVLVFKRQGRLRWRLAGVRLP
jgi:Protein of unknown function (DUF2939)